MKNYSLRDEKITSQNSNLERVTHSEKWLIWSLKSPGVPTIWCSSYSPCVSMISHWEGDWQRIPVLPCSHRTSPNPGGSSSYLLLHFLTILSDTISPKKKMTPLWNSLGTSDLEEIKKKNLTAFSSVLRDISEFSLIEISFLFLVVPS